MASKSIFHSLNARAGHTLTQVPQLMHFASHEILFSTSVSAITGHTLTQPAQPMHLESSIFTTMSQR